MDKPLSSNDKKDNLGLQETTPANSTAATTADFSQNGLGAYGTNGNHPIDLSSRGGLSRVAWQHAGEEWNRDWKKRLAIRVFSRGMLGAVFFTAGGLLAQKWMLGKGTGYDPAKGFLEQKNPLQFIAKTIDTVIGKPIAAVFGEEAVRFRPTHHRRENVLSKTTWGRSLGDEMVMVTFDFFSASIGDALGRDIVGWVDPNAKKGWQDDQGNFSLPTALKNMLKTTWRYVSYNGGEDWAVALPYVYYMKGQRALINHFSPGFKYDFDQGLNGGSHKVAGNPFLADGKAINTKHRPEVIGNYAAEASWDLQGRFTVYNIGTLMYREAYDYIADKMAGRQTALYGAPDKQESKSVLGKAADVAKWVARSVIKGGIYMTPAVPFFWITRANQAKHRGLFIHKDLGMMVTFKDDAERKKFEAGDKNAKMQQIHANDMYSTGTRKANINPEAPVLYSAHISELAHVEGAVPWNRQQPMYDAGWKLVDNHYPVHINAMNPAARHGISRSATHVDPQYHFHPYRMGQDSATRSSLFETITGRIGSWNYQAGKLLDPLAKKIDGTAIGTKIKGALGIAGKDFTRFTHPFVNASISYTPYMYAKAEAANLWDNGKMDLAAERLIDGATKLNWGEFSAGVGEVWNSILHRPFSDPAREAEAQHRRAIDTSAPDIFEQTQYQVDQERKQQKDPDWRQRIISGKAPEKTKAAQEEKRHPQKKSISHAEQEAMRKALEELHPPTNSIN